VPSPSLLTELSPFHASGGSKWDFVRRPGRRGRVGDDAPLEAEVLPEASISV
jgi:hypothetical protein